MRNLGSPILCDTAADLRTFDGAKLFNKTVALVGQINETVSSVALATPAAYRWVAGSTSPDNNQSQLCVVPTTGSGSGRWLRADQSFDLILPVTFATADAAALCTVPAELCLLPHYLGPFWEMITAWAGGAAPMIGLSYTNQATALSQGSLLGGGAGDGTFPQRSYYRGTAGFAFGTGLRRIVLNATATVNFDRIVDAFTSGTGNAHVPVQSIFAPIIPINPAS